MTGDAALDAVTTGNYHRAMKVVGVKELKARLSEYIRLAKAGESILVTERNEVVAELRGARRQAPVVAIGSRTSSTPWRPRAR